MDDIVRIAVGPDEEDEFLEPEQQSFEYEEIVDVPEQEEGQSGQEISHDTDVQSVAGSEVTFCNTVQDFEALRKFQHLKLSCKSFLMKIKISNNQSPITR